jgi:RecJ-like exonuclease
MTVKQSKNILEKKLIFGDTKQIEALNILRLVDKMKELKEQYPNIDYTCVECFGTGLTQYKEECDYCDGTGDIELVYYENANRCEVENQIEVILEQIA